MGSFVNKVMLMGNTTWDPVLRELPSGTQVCEFGLATNRVYRTANGEERQETAFVDCTAFGRLAEVVAEFAPKGRPLFVEGRLHFESWDDKDGNRRSKLSVIAENVQLLGGRVPQEGEQGQLLVNLNKTLDGKSSEEKRAKNSNREVVVAGPANNGSNGSPAPKGKKKPGKWRTSEDKYVDQVAAKIEAEEDIDLPF